MAANLVKLMPGTSHKKYLSNFMKQTRGSDYLVQASNLQCKSLGITSAVSCTDTPAISEQCLFTQPVLLVWKDDVYKFQNMRSSGLTTG